jgi:hypothetical protein
MGLAQRKQDSSILPQGSELLPAEERVLLETKFLASL